MIGVGSIVCFNGDDMGIALGLGLVTRIHRPRGRTSERSRADVLWANGHHLKGIQVCSLLPVNSAYAPGNEKGVEE
jgi:hypothetical protein